MQPNRPRARRFPFVTNVEVTDLQSEIQTIDQISDLSLFGCQVEAAKPLPAGTRVRIRIVHKGETFAAMGKVANVRPNAGMGIVFTGIEEDAQSVLEKWVAELREHQ
jgi:PilZ domain-containing protein